MGINGTAQLLEKSLRPVVEPPLAATQDQLILLIIVVIIVIIKIRIIT